MPDPRLEQTDRQPGTPAAYLSVDEPFDCGHVCCDRRQDPDHGHAPLIDPGYCLHCEVHRNPAGARADAVAASASKPLVCPYCGSSLEFELSYTGHAYSEHRDLTGIGCSNYDCLARWTPSGDLESGPKKLGGEAPRATYEQGDTTAAEPPLSRFTPDDARDRESVAKANQRAEELARRIVDADRALRRGDGTQAVMAILRGWT